MLVFLLMLICLQNVWCSRPHIILIIADDLGWNDVSLHGSNEIPTPNIDAIAYNGVSLNRHYVLPACTPSRAALLTGRYPIYTGMQGWPLRNGEPRGLPLEENTLPQRLQELGYVTRLVGKWHLGFHRREYTPTNRGFHSFFGYWNGYIGYHDYLVEMSDLPPEDEVLGYDLHRDENISWAEAGHYATQVFTKEAVRLISEHDETEGPLFLQLSHLAVHSGRDSNLLEVPDLEETNTRFSHIASPQRRLYAGMVKELDESVGCVFEALEQKGVLNDTIIVFLSDNGAPTVGLHRNYGSNWPLRGVGVVLGVYSDEKRTNITLTSSAVTLNQKTNGELLNQIKLAGAGISQGKGQILYNLHPDYPIVAAVGLGEEKAAFNDQEDVDEHKENIRSAAAAGCQLLKNIGVSKVLVEGLGCPESAAEGATLGLWMFQRNKQKEKQKKIPEIGLFEASTQEQSDWDRGIVKAEAQNLVRTFGDTPANQLTPTIFATEAKNLLSKVNVDVKIHDKEWAKQKKMGAFLSVSRGSDEEPIFLELRYNGSNSKEGSPVVMVGKGVTFDTGGISLKPSKNMDLMRFDMSGGACVVATILAAAKLKIPINVVGLIPLTENMPGGKATKPGDVVFAMNGKSIIVDNTDAEGRLILADALCYAQEFKPLFVLDIATLTGAMVVALGGSATGVFTNSTQLFKQMQKAGVSTGDRVWRMPVWKCFTKRMTASPSCDILNIPKDDGGGGSCTAAAFLKEFAPEGNWMHLDIAGVANSNGGAQYLAKGMTGRPTRTLIEFLVSYSKC